MLHEHRRAFLIFFGFCALLFVIFQAYHLHLSNLTEAYLRGYGEQQIDRAWKDFRSTCQDHLLFLKVFDDDVDQLTANYFRRELSRIERTYYLQTLELRGFDGELFYGPNSDLGVSAGVSRTELIMNNEKSVGRISFSFSLPFESLLTFQQKYLLTGSIVIFVIMILGLITIKSMLSHIFALEKENDRSRKLAEFGSISAGVAHDIRNPLAVILLQLEALRQMHEGDIETQEYLKFIKSNAKRINHTISTLLVFNQENLDMEQEINLIEVIMEAVQNASLWHAYKNDNVKINLESVILVGNHNLMIRMVENLLRNALESHESKSINISINGYYSGQTYLLEIEDAGKGIENIQEIFEPFYTTKNYGTGLGLQVVKDAVERHKALIHARKNDYGGSTFVIEFQSFKRIG